MDQDAEEAEARAAEYPGMLMYPGVVSMGLSLYVLLFLPSAFEDAVGIQGTVTIVVLVTGCFFFARDGWLLITKKAKTILPDGGLLIGVGILSLVGAFIVSSEEGDLGFYAASLGTGALCLTAGLVPFKCRAQFKEWRDSQGKEEA